MVASLDKLVNSKLLERNNYLKHQETRCHNIITMVQYLKIPSEADESSHNKKEDFLNDAIKVSLRNK